MRLLVFGRSGQVATELLRLAGPGLEVAALGRSDADLADPAACAAAVQRAADSGRADVVVNAAAYTDVDGAEAQEDLATIVNGEAPGAMARAAARHGLPFLHISTDFVFDGTKDGPWREDDPPAPLSAYGRSKLAGERAVAAAAAEAAAESGADSGTGGTHLVLRTAWVHAGHGSNFVRAMLNAGASRPRLTVVEDQLGGPTAAADIALALVRIARAFAAGRGVPGIFHYCGAPATSRCAFAREIFAQATWMRAHEIVAIRSADWPAAAARPANSMLDCTKIAAAYGIAQPDWRVSLGPILAELRTQNAA